MYALSSSRSFKAISPLVAVIMLIAFTLIIAGILAGWSQQFTTKQTQQIEYCLKASVFLYSASYDDGIGGVKMTVYNNGEVPLAFKTLVSFNDGGLVVVPTDVILDQPNEVPAGQVKEIPISSTDINPTGSTTTRSFSKTDIKSITIQSPRCPGAQDFLLAGSITNLPA